MTPRCPKYRGVAKLDPLKIQKSPKYRRVETPQCPRYRRVKTLQYFASQNSPVSYVPGSRDSRCPMYQGVETPQCPMYRGVFFCFLLPLKQNSFKKLFNISIYYTNIVQTCLKIFPITRFLGRLPGVPSDNACIEHSCRYHISAATMHALYIVANLQI